MAIYLRGSVRLKLADLYLICCIDATFACASGTERDHEHASERARSSEIYTCRLVE